MGQRLVVTINSGEKDLAKIYYHWSAYTQSAFEETANIIDAINELGDVSEDDLKLHLVRYCENNGGGIRGCEEELNYISKLYPTQAFKSGEYSRNNGLIALSESGMSDLQMWSEGDVCINLDTKTVDFYVLFEYDNISDYNEQKKGWDDDFEEVNLQDIHDAGHCLSHFEMNSIRDIIDTLESASWDDVVRYGGRIYEMIA